MEQQVTHRLGDSGSPDVYGCEIVSVDSVGPRQPSAPFPIQRLQPPQPAGTQIGLRAARFMLTRSAEAFAMMCPTLLLRLLKKDARLEKTAS